MKRLFIFGIVLLIFASFGFGLSTYDNIIEGYHLEGNFLGALEKYNGSNGDTTTNITGINGTDGRDMAGVTNDYFTTPADLGTEMALNDKSWAVSFWFKVDSMAADNGLFDFQDLDQVDIFARLTSTHLSSHVAGTYDSAIAFDDVTNWQHYVLTYNGNNFVVYLNGFLRTNTTETDPAPVSGTHYWGCYDGPSYCADIKFDELVIFNIPLNLIQVTELKNAGANWSIADTPPLPPTASLNISSPRPLNYTQFNTNVMNFNLTANSSQVSSLVSYYPFNDSNGYDEEGRNNGTINGVTFNATGGILGGAFEFNGNDSYMSLNNPESLNITGTEITISAWIKPNALFESGAIVDQEIYRSGSANYNILRLENSNGKAKFHTVGKNPAESTATSWNKNTWYHLVGVYNGSNSNLYVNGVLDVSVAGTGTITQTDNNIVYIGSFGLTNEFDGTIDEVSIWDKALNSTQIESLYNAGVGLGYIDSKTQADNLLTCDLYFNSTLNKSSSFFITGNDNIFVSFTQTIPDGNYNYYVQCNDGTTIENTTTNTFYVDSNPPYMTWTTPADNNQTKVNLNDSETFISNILLVDPNIYSYNYNITYLNGTLLYNYSNSTLTGLSSYTLNQTINMSNNVGGFYASAEVCDGHTKKEIKDKVVTMVNTELSFDDFKIIPVDKLKIKDYNSVKKKDRYNFIFKTNNKQKEISFYVESPNYIDILNGQTEYKGHLVTGKQWIDFELLGLENVEITRINDNKVQVDIKAFNNKDYWEFNSIGELNCLTETKEFYVFEEKVTYDNETLSYYTNQHNLTINYSAAYFSGYSMTAYLVYDGTSYNASQNAGSDIYTWVYDHTPPTITNDTSYNFYWNYTLDGTTYYQTDTLNQEVILPRLTNCSEGSKVISFILNDESLLNYLNADIDLDFTYWNQDGNVSQISTFGYTYENTYNATLCMYPTYAPLVANAYLINSVNTSYSHRYFLVNANLTGLATTPSSVDLYNFIDTTDKNTMEVNIVDQYYNPVSDIVVKLQRYYPSGIHQNTSISYAHSWKTTQVDKSDEFGQTIFHVSDSGDTDYYFILESNTSILKQTATLKLLCPDPTDCKVTFQIDTSVDNSIYSLFDSFTWSYDETTELVLVTWNDPTLLTSSIGVAVTQEKSDGQLIICEQTFTTSAGSYSCNTTGYSGTLRVSAYRTASPLVKFLDAFIDKLANTGLSSKLNGEGALWGALIFIGVVTASATSVIGVIIASILGLIVIFLTGITNVITLSFLVMSIIVGLIIAFKLQR